MTFRITGLPLAAFAPLFALDDAALARLDARRMIVPPGADFPCRVSLTVASPGETVILANYEHQPARSPYRARGPVFVREAAHETALAPGAVPDGFRDSLLSLRAYDADGMILAADVTPGAQMEPLAAVLLSNPNVAYLHAHYARRGCFAARIGRA